MTSPATEHAWSRAAACVFATLVLGCIAASRISYAADAGMPVRNKAGTTATGGIASGTGEDTADAIAERLVLAVRRMLQSPTPAGVAAQFPVSFAHVQADIETLRDESALESIGRLHNLSMYTWPGTWRDHTVFGTFPVDIATGDPDVDTIMSNRRVLKVIGDLDALGSAKAGTLVSGEIRAFLPVYKQIIADDIKQHWEYFDPKNTPNGMGFRMSDNEDGTPTLPGARWKLLSLVFAAGQLRLEEAHPAIAEIARESMAQYRYLSDSAKVNIIIGSIMLNCGGLYNRQIVATALLETDPDRAAAGKLVTDLGLKWKEKRLTTYDALATPYDLYVRHGGGVPVDYSKGSRVVRYLAPIDDATYAKILEAYGAK